MRFLGITETCDLGALYLRLLAEGHEVRIAISESAAQGTMAGLVPTVSDWAAELPWIAEAGSDGVILFESVSTGFGARQDDLRARGFQVIGGSAFGDRLENDRAFAQAALADIGFPAGHVWEFAGPAQAAAWLATHPRRTVAKYSGPAGSTVDNFLGRLDDGADVLAYLRGQSSCDGGCLILMDFIDGVEVGIGAYFDGTRFLRPACLDWEHKRFFAGDMGELTGEMGTVATFEGSGALFERTLLKLEPLLRGRGHVGYVNLNTIVDARGIWPLEFTCRFGYPGFAILGPLQKIGWGKLFAGMLAGDLTRFPTSPGFSTGIVVTTPPFPYTRKQVDEPVGLPVLLPPDMSPGDRANVHFGEVGLHDGQLVTSGLYGWTLVVTGTGETIDHSRANALRLASRIVVPRGRYRLDIGERTAGEIARLRAWGLIGDA